MNSPILPAFPYSNCGESGRQAGDLGGRGGFDYQGARKQMSSIFDFLEGLMRTTVEVNFRNIVALVIEDENDKIVYIVEIGRAHV